MNTQRAKISSCVPTAGALGNLATWHARENTQINKVVEPVEPSVPECQVVGMSGHAREIWVLSFRAEGYPGIPTEIRIRRLLKAALRAYGLRCVDHRIAAKPDTRNASGPDIDTPAPLGAPECKPCDLALNVTDNVPHSPETMPDMGKEGQCSRPSWTKPAENLNRNDSGASELFRAEQGQTGTPAIAATPGKGQSDER